MILIFGFFSFKYLPVPLIVPPVPMLEMKCVILPSGVVPDFRSGRAIMRQGFAG
jgi:hypothetical protein